MSTSACSVRVRNSVCSVLVVAPRGRLGVFRGVAVALFPRFSFLRFSRFCSSGFLCRFRLFRFRVSRFCGVFPCVLGFRCRLGLAVFVRFFSVLLRLLFPFSFCLRPLGAWGVGGGVVAVCWQLRNVADGVGAFSGEL